MKILTDIELVPQAAGDLLVGGTSKFDRLAIGSTDQVLTVAGGTAVWADPVASSGGGGGGTDIMALIYDQIANGTDDPIDFKITSGAYVILGFFKGNNTSGWSSPTNAKHTVTSGKRLIVVGAWGSSILIADNGSRKARLRNVTDSADVIADSSFAQPYGSLSIVYSGDGGSATVLSSAASGKNVELQLWNTDTTKRAMGAVVICREV